jgi:hypothetical protein
MHRQSMSSFFQFKTCFPFLLLCIVDLTFNIPINHQSLLIHASKALLRPNHIQYSISFCLIKYACFFFIWDIHEFDIIICNEIYRKLIKLFNPLIVLSFNHKRPQGGPRYTVTYVMMYACYWTLELMYAVHCIYLFFFASCLHRTS